MVQIDIEKPKRCFDCSCYDSVHKECLFGPVVDDMNTVAPDCPMTELEKDDDYKIFIKDLRNIDGAFDYLSIIRDRMLEVGMDNYDGRKVDQWIKDGWSCLDGFTTYIVRRYLWRKGLSWKQTETGGC